MRLELLYINSLFGAFSSSDFLAHILGTLVPVIGASGFVRVATTAIIVVGNFG
ncbi:unnamed protein product [Camellia sinensis]